MGAKHFFSHSLDARKRSPASREHHSIAQLRVKALVANTVVNLFENILNFDVNNRRKRLFAQDPSAVITVPRRRRKTNKTVFILSSVVMDLSHLQLQLFGRFLREVCLN